MTSLILPAYNPGPEVDHSWAAVADFLSDRARRGDPWDAVFVLDGCTDGTPERLAHLAEARPASVQVIGYTRNGAKGTPSVPGWPPHAARTASLPMSTSRTRLKTC